ncbi:MAG: DUF2191 domain-containing protein [Gammaproteobacteria bacterium]
MRTTLTIDDQLAKTLKALAHRSGKPFRRVINETLQAGLTASNVMPKPRPYTLQPRHMGSVANNLNLDKALALSDYLEDEELMRKLQLKK